MKLLNHLATKGKSAEVKQKAKESLKILKDARQGAAQAEAEIFAEQFPER